MITFYYKKFIFKQLWKKLMYLEVKNSELLTILNMHENHKFNGTEILGKKWYTGILYIDF